MVQLSSLKGRDSNEGGHGVSNVKKENDQGCWSNGSNNSSDINLEMSRSTQAINSPSSSQINAKNLFSSTLRPAASSLTQFLQGSSRPDLQGLKVDHHHHHHHQVVQEETFCSMFNGGSMEDQQGFWSWPDQQHHFHWINQSPQNCSLPAANVANTFIILWLVEFNVLEDQT